MIKKLSAILLLLVSAGMAQTHVAPFKTSSVTSTTANPATAGVLRSARADQVCWRNQANSANICIAASTANLFQLPLDPANSLPAFVGSGISHQIGAVPDPGASAGTTKYLREDASWQVPPQTFIWRAGALFTSAPSTGVQAIALPVPAQCTASPTVQKVTVTALTQGTNTMTFMVTRYNSAGASQGDAFSGNQTYNNAGNVRQDYSVTTTTAAATDFFKLNVVTVNGQANMSVVVEGTCAAF